ncbi:MAG: hypothetical protein ABI076_11200 [Acidobacteriaceae bacterium]
MILFLISTILASLALGVALAYGLCSALFAVARMHVHAHDSAQLQIQAKVVNL